MPKTLAIYFSDSSPMGYPFNKSDYFESYQEIISDLENYGLKVFIVRGKSYLKNGRFKKGWRFIDGILKESKGEIRADLIFNRDDKNTIPAIHDCKIINQPEFDQLCVDKFKTFEAFPDISPKTASINSFSEALKQIKKWQLTSDDMIVLKKNFLTEGRGIFILPVKNIKQELYPDWKDVLIQEFLDGSIGIPRIVKGLHDLRINVINGKPINAFLRVPKKGSYLANISQGGSGLPVDLKSVPKKVFSLVKKINQKALQYYPVIYSADFMNSPQGYKLVELNSRPGLLHHNDFKNLSRKSEFIKSSSATRRSTQLPHRKFNDAIVKMLVEAVK